MNLHFNENVTKNVSRWALSRFFRFLLFFSLLFGIRVSFRSGFPVFPVRSAILLRRLSRFLFLFHFKIIKCQSAFISDNIIMVYYGTNLVLNNSIIFIRVVWLLKKNWTFTKNKYIIKLRILFNLSFQRSF